MYNFAINQSVFIAYPSFLHPTIICDASFFTLHFPFDDKSGQTPFARVTHRSRSVIIFHREMTFTVVHHGLCHAISAPLPCHFHARTGEVDAAAAANALSSSKALISPIFSEFSSDFDKLVRKSNAPSVRTLGLGNLTVFFRSQCNGL